MRGVCSGNQTHQNLNAHLILGSPGVVSGVMWPCMCWKEIRKGTAEFSRAHFSVFRGTLSIQLQQVFGAEVCGAQLLNLTRICISLEMGFSSEFLLLFRDGVAFSEGSEGQCKDNWRAVLQDLCNKEPCPVSLIRTDQ